MFLVDFREQLVVVIAHCTINSIECAKKITMYYGATSSRPVCFF